MTQDSFTLIPPLRSLAYGIAFSYTRDLLRNSHRGETSKVLKYATRQEARAMLSRLFHCHSLSVVSVTSPKGMGRTRRKCNTETTRGWEEASLFSAAYFQKSAIIYEVLNEYRIRY